MKILRYYQYIKESLEMKFLPTYEDCVQMCTVDNPEDMSPFYEMKYVLEGYNISVFNYRLAKYNDFVNPIASRPDVKAYEMRGLTFVFNEDGSLYKRFLLLEKFFNINQVPESMYSVVRNYKIKFVNEKEDGSIASFIQLPNGSVYGKSKMAFDNDQALGMTRIYKTNEDVHYFINWCMENDIVPIMEYVAPHNRIVLKYAKEELILLKLRKNSTGEHISIKEVLDQIGTIRVAPFKEDYGSLDELISLTATEIDKEGYVIHAEDDNGKDFFFKLKTPWYCERHGLLTEDLYREDTLLGYILDDKIDDILGQIPEDEKEAHARINTMIEVVRKAIVEKSHEIDDLYHTFLEMGSDKKAFALKYHRHKDFPFVMQLAKGDDLKRMTKEEIIKYSNGDMDKYEMSLARCDKFEIIKDWLRDNTKRLAMARNWLRKRNSGMDFRNPVLGEDDN